MYNDLLEVLIPALETGRHRRQGHLLEHPEERAAPAADQELRGRKFCGSLSGNSMYTAAKLGCGNMILMLPQRGKEVPPDKYTEVWQEVHGDGSLPPAADARRQLLHRRERRIRRGAGPEVPRQHDARGDQELPPRYARQFPNIKGYEHYENMVLAPEAIEPTSPTSPRARSPAPRSRSSSGCGS